MKTLLTATFFAKTQLEGVKIRFNDISDLSTAKARNIYTRLKTKCLVYVPAVFKAKVSF